MNQVLCRRGVRALVAVLVLALSVSGAYGLDDQEQADLDKAQTAVKNAEADLKAARGSAGTAENPAKGSRAKLTAMRLDSADKRLGEASDLLAKLPADDDEVKAVQAKYDAAAKGVAEVRAILNPEAADQKDAADASDETGGEDAPAGASPAQAAPKLDYKQEKLLKDAGWYVRETDNYAGSASAVVARLDAEGSKPVHSEVRAALETVATGWKKHALAVGYIEQLPAGHPQVQPTADEVKRGGELLGALESRLKAVDVELAKLTGMEHYPDFENDFALLRDFTGRYYSFQLVSQQPEKLAQVVSEDGQVLAEVKRIAQTYLPLVEQRTDEGGQIEKQFGHFQSQRNAFSGALIEYKQQLPAAFEADIKEATDLADQGVAEQKPLFFGKDSGIEQRLGWAEQKLLVLQAFSEEEAKPYVERIEAVRGQIRERAKALESQIIAGNTLPPDEFTGGDRDEVVRYAKDAWAKEQPDAEVLMERIPSQAWTRDTRWQWSNGAFYKIDTSKLQVQLIVKHDDKLAVSRPINIYKNHLKGDTVTAFPMDEIDDELRPQRFMLLEKVE